MASIKRIWVRHCLRRRQPHLGQATAVLLLLSVDVAAANCSAPQRPFVPSDNHAVREYADLIQRDFELYFRDAQSYFMCLEEERHRAFEEAQAVSEEYARFLQIIGE